MKRILVCLVPILVLLPVFSLACDEATVPAQSPSSTGKIAFVSRRDTPETWGSMKNNEIYIVNTDGSGILRLTNNGEKYDLHPALSPDGKKIAFISLRGTNGIYLVSTDGSGETMLTDNLTDYKEPLEWSPDGTKIIFSGRPGRQENNYDIYTIDVDGSGLRRLTDAVEPDWAPAWSPDGTKIAFTRGPWLSDPQPPDPTTIWVMDSDGTNQMQISSGYAECPDWSPDGEKIVFTASIDHILQICVMNADGSDQKNLSNYEEIQISNRFPEWSPNGSKIAFVRWYKSGIYKLVVMNADGSDKRVISNCPTLRQVFSWSSDGDRIAFVCPESERNYNIYIENADGSNRYVLTDSSEYDYMVSWSN